VADGPAAELPFRPWKGPQLEPGALVEQHVRSASIAISDDNVGRRTANTKETNTVVKLRLMRMGKKKQPTYRVVAADARSPRNGRFIEIVGHYNPRTEPSTIVIDNDKAVHWLSEGAQATESVQKLLKISGAWEQFETAKAASSNQSDAKAAS
jgi:small subunit ribosomal protein S16